MTGKHRLAAALVMLVFILSASCAKAPNPSADGHEQKRLSVVVTFDALYEMASAVGGDRVSVHNIMPDGMEAHDFEPQAKDLAALGSADVFIANGLGFDSWAQRAADAAAGDNMLLVDASTGLTPISLARRPDEDDHHSDAHSSAHTAFYDPHIWLSPLCAVSMAENIRDAFCAADPDGSEHYFGNCSVFAQKLKALHDEYSTKIGAMSNKTIVTGHAVFAYLCRDFGLIQNSVEGVFAEGEPSAKVLVELIEFCIDNNISTILAENLSSPLVAETLAAETGAVVKLIYTMEGAEDGMSYIERMESNLATILEALR